MYLSTKPYLNVQNKTKTSFFLYYNILDYNIIIPISTKITMKPPHIIVNSHKHNQ